MFYSRSKHVCVGYGELPVTTETVNSPQGADEAVDGSLCIQGHDIPDMQETGGRVRHPAADSSDSDNKPQVEKKRNFLPLPPSVSLRDTFRGRNDA